MLTATQMDTLFENLKDAKLFAPIGDNRVKLRSGSMTGEWIYVGHLIDPTENDNGAHLHLAEHLFGKNKRQAKMLRERIAEWRSTCGQIEFETKMYDNR